MHPQFPKDWLSESGLIPSSDKKHSLFLNRFWNPSPSHFRALLVVHGMGEHSGRYRQFPARLAPTVSAVYTYDHRGHGQSEGVRGHVDCFEQLGEDLCEVLERMREELREKWKALPELHLFAHSLGGLIALRTLFLEPRLPLRSAQISAPLLGVKMPVPPVKKRLASVLSRIWGSIPLSSELDPGLLTHDPEVVEDYRNDPLVHNKVTPRFFTELMRALNDTVSRSEGISVPLQFLVPLSDQVVDSERTLGFFERLKSADKRLRTYPGFFHEAFHELENQRVFEDIREWIEKH